MNRTRTRIRNVSVTGLLTALVVSSGCSSSSSTHRTVGKIYRHDERFDELVAEGAVIEQLADGFQWSEGPVWLPEQDCLLFSDIPNNRVLKWTEEKGIELYLRPAGYTSGPQRGGEMGSNGLLLDADGNLVLCQHGDRRIARLSKGFGFETLADRFEGKRFNSPNDAVYHENGDLYFTDPPYGLVDNVSDPLKELDFQGVYRLSKSGELTLLTKDMTRPNGIAFSPDYSKLYVANSDPNEAIWMVYDVAADGTLENGKVFADGTQRFAHGLEGLPDGLKVDIHGNLFATGPGGVLVFSPGGKVIGTIETGQKTANVGFGDDGSTLYMTADDYLLRLRTTTRGLGF